MEYLQSYGKEVFALLVPLLVWWIDQRYKAKAKLKIASFHSFNFLINEPLNDANGNMIKPVQGVNTQSYLIVNHGRDTAHNVEVMFNWKPQYLNMWPVRLYTENLDQNGRYSLVFPSLSPEERVGLELLSVNLSLPEVINIRSDETQGRFTAMQPMEVYSHSFIFIVRCLLVLGASTAIYLALWLLQFLILGTN